jgi:6-phosphofructokinase 1
VKQNKAMEFESMDATIPVLGAAKILSPMRKANRMSTDGMFVTDNDRVVIDVDPTRIARQIANGKPLAAFEMAGPRERIYFDPKKLRCAMVTCGGLCPGLNDIIRAIVLELYFGYGVSHIAGIRYGLQGFIPEYGHDIMDLNPESVGWIHEKGGTILGSSRGPQPIDAIVDSLERMNIGILFMIGGDGTLKAAIKIADAIMERGLKISVVSIPKTIDNDIHLVSKSFGFDTAVDIATLAVKAAHNEAEGYPNGIGLIKLMGRYSGFIASTVVLSQQDVNYVLIPEVDFDLDGPNGLLVSLEKRLDTRKHAVIVVAEGAGQKFFEGEKSERDESGNIRLKDIGLYLKEKIVNYFKTRQIDISLKFIDPSYIIRSLPANANDRAFCSVLGRDAVHAGMAGKTRLLIGHWNNHFVHIPMSASADERKQVDPDGKLWRSILEATGQGQLKNSII